MKIKSPLLRNTTRLLGAVLIGCSAFGPLAVAQRINPVTGLPAGPANQPGIINPATGLPTPALGLNTPEAALDAAIKTQAEVHQLIFSGHFDAALQRLLAYHKQFRSGSAWHQLLPDWIELGRRYPKAKAALIAIRDRDVREFSEGRGYAELFSEVNSINGQLHQDDATYALFKSFRDQDPDLAQQGYWYVERLLVAKGEYQWCYEHMGDPQERFASIHRALVTQLDNQKRLAESLEKAKQRVAELNLQDGLTSTFTPPDAPGRLRKFAENSFIRQTRQLIEILVATGHEAGAEKIRKQAMAVLDAPELQSALSDVEVMVRSKLGQPESK